jgi:geranylgeranyl diphosphate synthase type I
VLVALTRKALPVSARNVLDELLGDPRLEDEQIRMLQSTIRSSGAVAEVENMITTNVERATRALDDAPLAEDAVERLHELTRSVSDRVA